MSLSTSVEHTTNVLAALRLHYAGALAVRLETALRDLGIVAPTRLAPTRTVTALGHYADELAEAYGHLVRLHEDPVATVVAATGGPFTADKVEQHEDQLRDALYDLVRESYATSHRAKV